MIRISALQDELKEEMCMNIQDVPFCTVDWAAIEPTIHPGVTGEAYWRTFEMGNLVSSV